MSEKKTIRLTVKVYGAIGLIHSWRAAAWIFSR